MQKFATFPIQSNSMKISLQSKPFSTTVKCLWANLAFEYESHCSYFGDEHTCLSCIYSDKWDNWHRRLTWHFFITTVCHAERMKYTFNTDGIHENGFLDTQFLSNRHLYICSPMVLKIHINDWEHVHEILFEVLWNYFLQFWNYVLLKVVSFYWDHLKCS